MNSTSRARLLGGLLISCLSSVSFSQSSQTQLLTDAAFSPTSFWYTPIPANAPLNPKSAQYVANFLNQIQTYYGNVNVNTSTFSAPLYIVQTGSNSTPSGKYSSQIIAAGPTVPRSNVAVWDCQNKGYLDSNLASQWQRVPIPQNAVIPLDSDAEIAVYDVTSKTYWDFWVTRKSNGWQACWGGRIANATTSNGIFALPYGATATGLPLIGGQITAEELARGEIKHAIGISLVNAETYAIVSWPALRSDGWNPNNAPNQIPEGLRFRLDPSINVNALNISRVAKIIAKAAQIYGFVIWDKAGALSIRAQNEASYTLNGQPSPYTALFNGAPSYAVLNGFPWNRLQFLPMDYGKP